MTKITGKIRDLNFIRLECIKGCGTIRRDIENNPTSKWTAHLLKLYGVKTPIELQKVYVCRSCRSNKAKKPQVEKIIQTAVVDSFTQKEPEIHSETKSENSDKYNMSYLIPKTESKYISRKIRGMSDMDILEQAYNFNLENSDKPNEELYNVLLVGDAGAGKSFCARYFAYKMKLPYKRINLNGATTPEDLVGQFIPNGSVKSYKWVDGWLTRFMRHGGILVLDEVNMAQADILAILNPILDRERTLILTQCDGETIKAHPKFMAICSMNANYEGTKPLNEALKDRFNLTLEFEYDPKVEQKLISNEKLLDFAVKLRLSYQNSEIMTPLSTRTLLAFQRNIATFGVNVAESILFNRFEKAERKVVEEIWRIIKGESEKTEEPKGAV